MRGETVYRIGVLLALVALLLGMCVHYGAVWSERTEYATTTGWVLDHGESQRGERVYVWLTADAVTETGFEDRGAGRPPLVVATDVEVTEGDVVQVFGTVEGADRIRAERTVVSRGDDRLRMFAVSAVAPLLVLAAVFRHWRVAWRDLALVPRGGRE